MTMCEFRELDDGFRKVYEKCCTNYPTLMRMEGIMPDQLDPLVAFKEYMAKGSAATIDANANVGANERFYPTILNELTLSVRRLMGYNALYEKLRQMFDRDVADDCLTIIFDKTLYFHDSVNTFIPYCIALQTSDIVLCGYTFNRQLRSMPPKRFGSYISILKEVTCIDASGVAGAIALPDIFAMSSHMIQLEGLDMNDPNARKHVENEFQSLVHTLNNRLRPSFQSPFTNFIVFDRPNIENVFKDYMLGMHLRYDPDHIMAVQKLFLDFFKLGDVNGRPYRFPIVTLTAQKDEHGEIIDKDTFRLFAEANTHTGCFNIYLSEKTKLSYCCRLITDGLKFDSFGNGGLNVGSLRVVSINMARLGEVSWREYEKGTEEGKSLDRVTESNLRGLIRGASMILDAHREIIKEHQSLSTVLATGRMSLKRMFCTIGLNGLYECAENLRAGDPIARIRILCQIINDEVSQINKEYKVEPNDGVVFNVEQVPAESLGEKFATADRLLLSGYIPPRDVYSNQIPLDLDMPITRRIVQEGQYLKTLSGGGICHINMVDKIQDADQMEKLMHYCAKNGLEYFAVNYVFSQCEEKHTTVTARTHCFCGKPIVDKITRIIGYYVPVREWNRGRQREFVTRKFK